MPISDEVATPSLEQEMADIALDAQDAEPTAPTDAVEEASPPNAADVPAESEAEDPDAQAVAADPEVLPPTWQPPEGGEPFAFRADGREVPVEGAMRWEHGIYVPTQSWATVQRHLADREAFAAKERHYQSQISSLDPEQNARVKTADAYLQWVDQQLSKSPEEVAEWLDNMRVNKPLLDAQIKTQILEAQLQSKTSQVSDVEYQQRAQQIGDALPGYLKQHIDHAIQQIPELKDLAGQSDALLHDLWDHREYLFVEAVDGDMPEHGLTKGQIGVHAGRLKHFLTKEAQYRAETKRLQAAASVNAKALGKTKPSAAVATRGAPTPGSRSKDYQSGDRSWKDDFLSDPLED